MPEFQKVDQVRFRSGGPKMTIVEVQNNSAKCVWFDGATKKEAVFDLDMLEKITQSPQPVARRTPNPFSRTRA